MPFHGDCPIHGPFKLLDDSAGQDQALLAYTQVPVPCPLTVKPSSIIGAGMGVFTNHYIPKRVRMGPFEGRRVDKQDIGNIQDNTYAWEVSVDMMATVEQIRIFFDVERILAIADTE